MTDKKSDEKANQERAAHDVARQNALRDPRAKDESYKAVQPVASNTDGQPILDPATQVERATGAFGQDPYDEDAVQKAQERVADANKAAADTFAKDDAGNPLRGPVDIGQDDRGLDRDVRVDPADNQMKTFVSNHTDGSKDPDTGKPTPADQLPHKPGERPDTDDDRRRRGKDD